MEGEMMNLIKVSLTVAVSLSYCYFISSKIPKGLMRLVSFLPVICIFLLLPLLLSSVMLQQGAGLFIAWLANFKLLLLALGPDDGSSKVSLFSFILITALPIEMKQTPDKNSKKSGNNLNSPINIVILSALWCFLFAVYVKKPFKLLAKPLVIQFLFLSRLTISVQLTYTFAGFVASKLLKHELQPQFDDPHLATSLQNFWGKRWNLMNSNVLRSTVYTPTRSTFTPIVGSRSSRSLAIITTFAVSGLMHEMVNIYMGAVWPTWEVMWCFVINGVCVAIEIEVKKKASAIGWVLHPMISRLLTNGFITITSTFLSCIELIRAGTDVREVEDYVALVDYVKNVLCI